MVFPAVPLCENGTHIHPWPLYESLADWAIFALLFWLFRRRAFPGQVFLVYVMTYAVARGLLEFLRGDDVRGLYFGGGGLALADRGSGGFRSGVEPLSLAAEDRHREVTMPRLTIRLPEGGRRLDALLARLLKDEGLTRSQIQRLMEAGLVSVGGSPAKASTEAREGQVVVLDMPGPRPSGIVALDLPPHHSLRGRSLHRGGQALRARHPPGQGPLG